MAFADPQTITIATVAQVLNRTSQGDNLGAFSKDTGDVKMSVDHKYAKRTRRSIRIDHRKVAVDPLVPANNVPYSMSMYIVVDTPPVGYSPAEVKQIWDGFIANLAASSAANTVKFLGGES